MPQYEMNIVVFLYTHYWTRNSTNNLSSLFGLIDARMGAFWQRFICTARSLNGHVYGVVKLNWFDIKIWLFVWISFSCSDYFYFISGYLTYSASYRVEETEDAIALETQQSSMSTMVVYDGEKYYFMYSLQFGIPQTYLIMTFARKLTNPVGKLRLSVK